MISRINNHAASALLKLIAPFWGKPRMGSLLVGVAEEIQAAEDAVLDVIELRDLDAADDERLRVLGKIVGQPRLSTFTTEDYRAAIRARIQANRGNGSRPNLVKILQLLLGAIEFTIRRTAPAELAVEIDPNYPDIPSQALRNILPLAKGAGKTMHLLVGDPAHAYNAVWGSSPNVFYSSPAALWGSTSDGALEPKARSVYDIGA